jgi:VWFA-related protein
MIRRAAVVAVLALGVSVSAQRGNTTLNPINQPQRQQPPVFRSGVELVHLDVSVLDQARRPVRGLAPADFTVLENGQPQNVAVFSAVDIPDVEAPKVPWVRDIAPDVKSNQDVRERRLFLILMDDAAIQADPYALNNVKSIARGVIDRLHPSDLAAVVFMRDNKHSQDFTSDRARLLAAIDRFAVGFRDMGGSNTLYFHMSVDVVRRAVEVLKSLPDRRKAMVYIGQGVPVDLATAAAPVLVQGLSDGKPSNVSVRGEMANLSYMMSLAFRDAARANVNVYTFDACGLRVEKLLTTVIEPTCIPSLEVDYIENVAAATGGRAVVNTGDFEPGLNQLFIENGSYYLLGYQSTNPAHDGKTRRIEVRVNRPGVTVRARNGYEADRPNDAKRKAELAAQPLGTALAGVLPKGDLPMQLTAAPFAIPGKKEALVAVMLGVQQPVRESAARVVEKVDLQVNAYDTNGRFHGGTRLRADVTVRGGASGLADYEVLARLNLKPGRYQLRTAASVGSLTTSGSLYYDVDIPDFSEAPLSLSGLVMTSSPARQIAPADALKNVIPVVPTSQRVFPQGTQASAFVRVYQGGKKPMTDVPFWIELRNQDDHVVLERRDDVRADAFGAGTRAADINVALPIPRLARGSYLLTVAVGAKAEVRRFVRFEVR